MNYSSELRQDLVSGDWVMISPRRAKKGPLSLIKKESKRKIAPQKNCPFCDPKINPGKLIACYPQNENWRIKIIQNKYPAVTPSKKPIRFFKKGPYFVAEARGCHHVVITKDHYKNFAHLNRQDANLLFEVLKNHYLKLAQDPNCAYISIFHNWGPKAGASVYHPHYQIISIPVIPPDVAHSLSGSTHYFKKHKKCVHCEMIKHVKKEKKLIVYENQEFIVFTPFVAREPFELRIFPKKHFPYFENTPSEILNLATDALQKSLSLVEKRLNDPDYNFFLHTASVENKQKYHFYHWHIEMQPKISISAGFELATGVEITVVDPNDAAKILRHR